MENLKKLKTDILKHYELLIQKHPMTPLILDDLILFESENIEADEIKVWYTTHSLSIREIKKSLDSIKE